MSTPNPPSKQKVPEPPPEPADLVAKRDQLMAELEKTAKNYSGVLQQVLRKSAQLLQNTKPEGKLDNNLYNDVKAAFLRYSQDTAAPAAPPVLIEFIEWLQAYVNARPPTVAGNFGVANPSAPPPPAPTAAAPAPAAPSGPGMGGAKDAKDGFESGNKRRASLTGESPIPVAGQAEPKSEQQQLESFKAWMKNPSLGKTKG